MTTEVVLAIIGIAATFASGLMYVAKRESDSRAAKVSAAATAQIAEANARAVQAQADLRDAEARLATAKSQEAQNATLMKMLSEQLKINEAWLKQLEAKEKSDERNYQVLKQLDDENTKYLSTQIIESGKTLASAIEAIPARLEQANVETARAMGKEIGREVAAEIVKLLVEWRMEIASLTAPVEKKVAEATTPCP